MSDIREFAAKLRDAIELAEQKDRLEASTAALKTENARLEKDREKLLASLKQQADVEAKAAADAQKDAAHDYAKRVKEAANEDASKHFQSVKADAAKILDTAREQHAEIEKHKLELIAECDGLKAELKSLRKQREETVAQLHHLADLAKSVA